MPQVYANGDTVPGGAYVGFKMGGACSRLIGPDITQEQLERAFEDITHGSVKVVSMDLDDKTPLFDDVASVIVRNMMAADAATLKGQIINSISAMNSIHIPLVYGCRGMRLIDEVIYSASAPAVAGAPPAPKKDPVSWQTAILVVGLAILALALIAGVREFKASTGLA